MASFTFNGLNSETDYDLRIHDVLYNVLPQTIDRDVKVPYGRGRYDYGTYLDSNTIGFVCSLQGTSYADVFTQVEAIAAWLNPELGVFELSYSGKPNRHCYAKISGNTSVKQILLYGKFTVIFKIPEGVWYGDEVEWTSNEATLEDEEVGSIFTTPSDMADAPMKADLSGMTVTPLGSNMSFENDGTGWTFSGLGTKSYDTTIKLHGTKSLKYVLSGNYKNAYQDLTGAVGDKIYLTIWSYLASQTGDSTFVDNRVLLRNTGYTNTYGTLSFGLTTGSWIRKSVIITLDATGSLNISLGRGSSVTATYYFDSIIPINLTAHGLDSITDTAVLDAMFPHYIEGTVHAGATRFTSAGKNLFDGEIENGAISISTGLNTVGNEYVRSKNYTEVKPSTTYYLNQITTGNTNLVVLYYDMNKNFISFVSIGINGGSFTTLNNAQYIRFRLYKTGSTLSYLTTYNFQLELGSTATTYEPYHDTHTTGTLPELRRLPNDVRDTYDLNTGVKVQRVQRYELQSADITAYTTSTINIDYVTLTDTTNFNDHSSWNGSIQGNLIVTGFRELANNGVDSATRVGGHAKSANNINVYLIVAKGTYADLAAAQAALAGTVIYYQLDTPIISFIDPELENQDDEAVNFLLGGPSYTVNIDIDGCPCPMTRYGTMEVIENNGGLSTEGVIEITCDFNTSFLEIRLDDSNEFIRIEDTFLINDVIEINLNTGSVTKNGTSILDKVTLASTLFDGTFKILRGTSLLSLHGASELTLVFEEKWL